MDYLILTAALLAALGALLNFVRAPNAVWAWKVAVAVSEFGHWLAIFPLGVAVLAAIGSEGWSRSVALALCGFAVIGLLRPVFCAWRMAPAGSFSFRRLYWRAAAPTVAVRTEVFARMTNEELKLDFYAPPSAKDSTRRPPCIIVIHGGGWDSGDNSQLPEWNHRWASRGFAVAAVTYRLAPQHRWPAQRDDAMEAIAWLKANAERLNIDPHRLILLGRSAGGQIATAVGYGARDPDIVGVIALYAPHDMKFAWSVSREDDALNSIKLMRQYLGGPPDTPERVALYDSASGQLLARPDSPPALLIHGYPDTLVWHRHSRRLAAHFAELGVKHTHLELPWATHAFDFNTDGPAGQLADAAIARFLAEEVR